MIFKLKVVNLYHKQMKTARIYKVTNIKTVDIYVGSTTQTLKERFKAHKSNAKLEKTGKLYDCIRENGIENFTIELLEEFHILSKEDIGLKEKEYYTTLRPSLNSIAPAVSSSKVIGRIYKVYEKIDNANFYIGSTTNDLNIRLIQHQSASMKGKTPLYTYIREKGRNNFVIELVEDNIEIENLIIRENDWLYKLTPPLNKNIFLTRSEKERDKAKYEKNKEKIKNRVNERRKMKRDEINAQKREHYAKNKETILAKQKTQEYKDNANKIRRERRAREKREKES